MAQVKCPECGGFCRETPRATKKEAAVSREEMSGYDNNCPIVEMTGEGIPCGRCMFYCPGGICPRHGDVNEPLTKLRQTGKLTREEDFREVKHGK